MARVATWKTAGYEYCQVPKEANGIMCRGKRRESPGTVYGRVLDGERRELTATTADAWTDDGRRSASLSLSGISVSSLSYMRLRLRDEQVGVQCYQGTQRRQEPLPGPRLVIRNSTFHLPPQTFRVPYRDQVYPGNCFDAPFCRLSPRGSSLRIGMLQHSSRSRVLRFFSFCAMVEHRLRYSLSEDRQFI